MEGRYGDVWAQIATHTPFPNTTRAAESIDNGAGISWNFSVPPGGQSTFSHYTTFSPRGIAGPPPTTTPATPSTAFGPNGILDLPSNRACVSRRYFRIKLRKKFWPTIVGVTIKMPRTTRVLRARPWGTIVDLRGLPKVRSPSRSPHLRRRPARSRAPASTRPAAASSAAANRGSDLSGSRSAQSRNRCV